MSLLWAALVPAIACAGSAWSCGAPLHMVGILAFAGLLSGLTGGGIVLDHHTRGPA